jgi:FKBP-type peptidyl-prolyl cis-trans isomerase
MKTKFNKSFKNLKILVLLLTFSILTGCLKTDDGEAQTPEEALAAALSNVNFDQLQNDFEVIDQYIETMGLTDDVLNEPNGVRYKIHTMGTGAKPRLISTVRIKYSGRLLDTNVEIDANDDLEITLLSLILGFQTTLPLFPEGTVATLYIPSGYAYGPTEFLDDDGSILIPLNSNMIFDVELLEVQ